jgi:tetratricopeptide (TPR) repeat protein
MPNEGRVLAFPTRDCAKPMSRGEALFAAHEYLGAPRQNRTEEFTKAHLENADTLSSIFAVLKDRGNVAPGEVLEEAKALYEWLSGPQRKVGFFDESDYFRGESALHAGAASRLVGTREETERWLDRAEACFRHTINPAPMLARVAYIRLALRFDTGRYEEVVELIPSLHLTFGKLAMAEEYWKCRFLEGMAFKAMGNLERATIAFEDLVSGEQLPVDDGLKGTALINLGNLWSGQGDHEAALKSYSEALPLLKKANRPVALADLKAMVGETLGLLGRRTQAIDAYREAVADYVGIGAATRAAYIQVVLAEVLLEAERPREAEWQIAAALPTIEREKMVPEGLAAVVLLRESVRQRNANPTALAEVRRQLQPRS